MKITIVTASYNSSVTLPDTINSILSQSYQNWEHIIIDGGSKDNTLEIIKKYEPEYKGRLKWISESDKGIYDAMNKGIRMATGDMIGILNSDDFYASKDTLKKIAENAKKVEVVYGDLVFVDATNTDKVLRKWNGSQHSKGAFLKGWHPAHPTFYARKELFDKYGFFDLDLKVSADFELMLRFLEKENASSLYIPETMVKMRTGGESTGSIKNIIEGNKNVLKAFKKNGFKAPPFYLIRRLAPKALDMLKQKLHIQ